MDILKDKTQKRYTYISRYTPFYYYYNTEDDKYIYGLTSHLNTNIPYALHAVKEYDTLESLSNYYYGRPDYFWIIADFNQIQDSFINLKENFKTLKIPSISDISFKAI